jgi:hypothetical protein
MLKENETMNRKATSILLRGVFAALAVSVVFAGSASAGPTWKFEGKALEGSENVVGGAEESGMTVPGLTTTCDNFLYNISIANSGGTGEGDLEEVPLYDCHTDGDACTVDAIEPLGLPWDSSLSTVSTSNYITVKGVEVDILYGGEECALSEILVSVTGSAGGLINNTTESATFNSSSFSATKTKLSAFGQSVQWNGFFPTEAFEWHREQALTVS